MAISFATSVVNTSTITTGTYALFDVYNTLGGVISIETYTISATNSPPQTSTPLATGPTSSTSTSIGTSVSLSSSNSISSISAPNSRKSLSPTSTSGKIGHGSASVTSTPKPTPQHRLDNDVVAGIVIAAALGLALATFLATFLIMRRQRNSGREQDYRAMNEKSKVGSRVTKHENPRSEPKTTRTTESCSIPSTVESYLPQSADDKSVQDSAKILLEQLELHVENFYRNYPDSSGARAAPGEDAAFFDSPNLPDSLSVLLARPKNADYLIKHALAHFVTSSISPRSESSLLPDDFVLVPVAAESERSTKTGFNECMSQWRVLTAYLRPKPSQDRDYIAQRDRRIGEMVGRFLRVFAPWRNLKHNNDECHRSLSAILTSAADLGIFLFSQPSDLRFYWPKNNEVEANSIVVVPSLIKTTDERGQSLAEPQVMLKAVIKQI